MFIVRSLNESCSEYMDYYSSVLWHLKDTIELAFLSHFLLEIDKKCSVSWVVLGNCFGLTNDHVNSLKCFKRATILNPNYAYAYTLQGHVIYLFILGISCNRRT